MHFLHPERFSLATDFELGGKLFPYHSSLECRSSVSDILDSVDENNEEQIKDLHEKLSSIMLRRLKKDVIKELPTKSERILRVEMSQLQAWWYKNILTRNYSALTTADTQVSLMNIAMELKKASNHPFLFPGAESTSESREENFKSLIMNSGKMFLLDKLLTRLKQDGHRVLIFSQMVRMLSVFPACIRCLIAAYLRGREQ